MLNVMIFGFKGTDKCLCFEIMFNGEMCSRVLVLEKKVFSFKGICFLSDYAYSLISVKDDEEITQFEVRVADDSLNIHGYGIPWYCNSSEMFIKS